MPHRLATDLAAFLDRHESAASPIEARLAPDVVRTAYSDCDERAGVVLHTVLGGDHSWPGGKPPPKWRVGATSTSLDATAERWAFFREHPLRSRQISSGVRKSEPRRGTGR